MSTIRVDTVSEYTSANGITIDGVSIKDSKIATANSIDSDVYVDGSIDTAHIADDQITLAKMAAGTDGNIISYDASGDPVAIATGTDGQVLTSTGAGSPPAFEAAGGGFTLATEQATTSGTAVTFGSIPTGTKQIVIMFEGVSFDSTNRMDVTIGDSGGLETTGYISTSGESDDPITNIEASTAEFVVRTASTGNTRAGTMTLSLKDSANFTWISTHTMKQSVNKVIHGGGEKSLSAELTQVSISGGTFDSGSINIMYI